MTRDNNDFINRLHLRFGEIDKRAGDFIHSFYNTIEPMIRSKYKDLEMNEIIVNSINDYGAEMFSFAQSTLDKDKEYSDFKKTEELKSMTNLVDRLSKNIEENDFYEAIHKKAKSIMIDEFPEIFDLSSKGFLLLERYAKLKNMAFLAILNRQLNNE